MDVSNNVRKQLVNCPECGRTTSMRQIEEWGTCEECRRKAEEESFENVQT